MLLRIVSIIFPVFAIAGLGFLYGRWKRPDMGHANQLNMDVFVPALVFSVLSGRDFDVTQFGPLALGGFAVVLGSGVLALALLPLLRANPRTFIPPMMFNNSGNMGIPLAVFAFGENALQAAVVLFIVENTLHFSLGLYILDHRTHPAQLLKMPVFIATIAGLSVSLSGLHLPQALEETVGMLGQVAIPLLLFALGVRFKDANFGEWRLGLLGAAICPLTGVAVALLILPWLDLDPLQANLLLVFGALPPAVLNYIVAEQYGQEPEKVASIVMLGNMASIVTIPLVIFFALS
jgi:hypothetical protein